MREYTIPEIISICGNIALICVKSSMRSKPHMQIPAYSFIYLLYGKYTEMFIIRICVNEYAGNMRRCLLLAYSGKNMREICGDVSYPYITKRIFRNMRKCLLCAYYRKNMRVICGDIFNPHIFGSVLEVCRKHTDLYKQWTFV